MKHFKRTISLVLVLAMMLGMSVTVRANDELIQNGDHGTPTGYTSSNKGRFSVAGQDFFAVVNQNAVTNNAEHATANTNGYISSVAPANIYTYKANDENVVIRYGRGGAITVETGATPYTQVTPATTIDTDFDFLNGAVYEIERTIDSYTAEVSETYTPSGGGSQQTENVTYTLTVNPRVYGIELKSGEYTLGNTSNTNTYDRSGKTPMGVKLSGDTTKLTLNENANVSHVELADKSELTVNSGNNIVVMGTGTGTTLTIKGGTVFAYGTFGTINVETDGWLCYGKTGQDGQAADISATELNLNGGSADLTLHKSATVNSTGGSVDVHGTAVATVVGTSGTTTVTGYNDTAELVVTSGTVTAKKNFKAITANGGTVTVGQKGNGDATSVGTLTVNTGADVTVGDAEQAKTVTVNNTVLNGGTLTAAGTVENNTTNPVTAEVKTNLINGTNGSNGNFTHTGGTFIRVNEAVSPKDFTLNAGDNVTIEGSFGAITTPDTGSGTLTINGSAESLTVSNDASVTVKKDTQEGWSGNVAGAVTNSGSGNVTVEGDVEKDVTNSGSGNVTVGGNAGKVSNQGTGSLTVNGKVSGYGSGNTAVVGTAENTGEGGTLTIKGGATDKVTVSKGNANLDGAFDKGVEITTPGTVKIGQTATSGDNAPEFDTVIEDGVTVNNETAIVNIGRTSGSVKISKPEGDNTVALAITKGTVNVGSDSQEKKISVDGVNLSGGTLNAWGASDEVKTLLGKVTNTGGENAAVNINNVYAVVDSGSQTGNSEVIHESAKQRAIVGTGKDLDLGGSNSTYYLSGEFGTVTVDGENNKVYVGYKAEDTAADVDTVINGGIVAGGTSATKPNEVTIGSDTGAKKVTVTSTGDKVVDISGTAKVELKKNATVSRNVTTAGPATLYGVYNASTADVGFTMADGAITMTGTQTAASKMIAVFNATGATANVTGGTVTISNNHAAGDIGVVNHGTLELGTLGVPVEPATNVKPAITLRNGGTGLELNNNSKTTVYDAAITVESADAQYGIYAKADSQLIIKAGELSANVPTTKLPTTTVNVKVSDSATNAIALCIEDSAKWTIQGAYRTAVFEGKTAASIASNEKAVADEPMLTGGEFKGAVTIGDDYAAGTTLKDLIPTTGYFIDGTEDTDCTVTEEVWAIQYAMEAAEPVLSTPRWDSTSKTYKMHSDVDLGGTNGKGHGALNLTVDGNKKIVTVVDARTLDLDGYTLTGASNTAPITASAALTVKNSGTKTGTDTTGKSAGAITATASNETSGANAIALAAGGSLTVNAENANISITGAGKDAESKDYLGVNGAADGNNVTVNNEGTAKVAINGITTVGDVTLCNWDKGAIDAGAITTNTSGDVNVANFGAGTIGSETPAAINAAGNVSIWNSGVTLGELPDDVEIPAGATDEQILEAVFEALANSLKPDKNTGTIKFGAISGKSVEIANYSEPTEEGAFAIVTGDITGKGTGTDESVTITNESDGAVKVASVTTNNAVAAPVTIENLASGTVEVVGAITADGSTTDGDVKIVNGTVTPAEEEGGEPTYTKGSVKTGTITGKIVTITNNSKDADENTKAISTDYIITTIAADKESKITNNAPGTVSVTTTGNNNIVTTAGAGKFVVDNTGSGKIEIKGTRTGVARKNESDTVAVTVTNRDSGTITIASTNWYGIYNCGDVTVENIGGGTIEITGASDGIYTKKDVTVTNSGNGTVSITGAETEGKFGIETLGNVSLTNGAQVKDETTGAVTGYTGNGDIMITGEINSGKLTATNYASFLMITGEGGVQQPNTNTGMISVSGKIATTGAEKSEIKNLADGLIVITDGTVEPTITTVGALEITNGDADAETANKGLVQVKGNVQALSLAIKNYSDGVDVPYEATSDTFEDCAVVINGSVATNDAAGVKIDNLSTNGLVAVVDNVTATNSALAITNGADGTTEYKGLVVIGHEISAKSVTVNNYSVGRNFKLTSPNGVDFSGTNTIAVLLGDEVSAATGDVVINNYKDGLVKVYNTVTADTAKVQNVSKGDVLFGDYNSETPSSFIGTAVTATKQFVIQNSGEGNIKMGLLSASNSVASTEEDDNGSAIKNGGAGKIIIDKGVDFAGEGDLEIIEDAGAVEITNATGHGVSFVEDEESYGALVINGATINATSGDGVHFDAASGKLEITAGTINGTGVYDTDKTAYGLNVVNASTAANAIKLYGTDEDGKTTSATYNSVNTANADGLYKQLLDGTHDWAKTVKTNSSTTTEILLRSIENYTVTVTDGVTETTSLKTTLPAATDTRYCVIPVVTTFAVTSTNPLSTTQASATPTLTLTVTDKDDSTIKKSVTTPYLVAASVVDDTADVGSVQTTADGVKSWSSTVTKVENGTEEINYTNAYGDGLTDNKYFKVTFTNTSTPTTGGGGSVAPTVTASISGDDNSVSLSVTTSNGTATVAEPKAADLEKVIGAGVDTGEVVIDLSKLNSSVDAAAIPTKTFDAIEAAVTDASNDADELTIKLPASSVTFDAAALDAIADQATGSTISLEVSKEAVSKLASAQQNAVKALDVQDVYSVTLTSGNKTISDFKGGSATVSVNYTLKAGQSARGIVVWYVAKDGTLTEVPATFANGKVTFTVSHFSNYVIAYDAERAAACPQDSTCPIAAFSDADAKAWYHDGVHWALENGAMSGMGNGTFAPNGTTTRAMVAQILWNLEGKPAYVGMSEYTDVDNDDWFGPAVRWASAEGIVTGYDGKFAPNDPVTREQLATMLYRYAQYKNIDVSVGEDTNILSYEDAFNVNTWAMAAMQWACGAGVMNGVAANGTMYLQPQNDATRAVVATMIARFCTEVAK